MSRLFGLQVSKWSLVLLAGDMAAFGLAVFFAVLLTGRETHWFFVEVFKIPLLFVAVTYILVFYIANLYDYYQDFRRHENLSRVILSCLAGILVAIMLFSYPSWRIIPRNFLEWQGVAFTWLTVLWRFSFSAAALPRRLQRHLLIIGAGSAGSEISEVIKQTPDSGLKVIGFIDDDPRKSGASVAEIPVLGNSKKLPDLIGNYSIRLVVVAITHGKSPALIKSLSRLSFQGVPLTDMSGLFEFLTGKVPTDHISDSWIFLQSLNKRMLYYRHIKRLMDLILSALLGFLTWPFMLLIALTVKLDSAGPVFFRQERLGQDGMPFHIIKFRTMIQDAESKGPQWAALNDSRITRVGRLLRKLRLDELPQLYNILKGEMSFIGPRPERDFFVKQFVEPVAELGIGRRSGDPVEAQVILGYRERVPHYSYRLLVKPGITGWAQVKLRYASSLEETKDKLEYDLYYIKNMGVLLDLSIALKTIRIVFSAWGR